MRMRRVILLADWSGGMGLRNSNYGPSLRLRGDAKQGTFPYMRNDPMGQSAAPGVAQRAELGAIRGHVERDHGTLRTPGEGSSQGSVLNPSSSRIAHGVELQGRRHLAYASVAATKQTK
jgi:hypothetical protein